MVWQHQIQLAVLSEYLTKVDVATLFANSIKGMHQLLSFQKFLQLAN